MTKSKAPNFPARGLLVASMCTVLALAGCTQSAGNEQAAANDQSPSAAAEKTSVAGNKSTESASGHCAIDNGVAYNSASAVANANNGRIFWTVETKIHHALALRLDNSNDRFIVRRDKQGDVSGDDCLRSGQNVRLEAAGFGDYLLADTTINSSVVKVSRDYGPPKYKGTGTFFIEKIGGSSGSEIRFGDSFRIRGTLGNAWLRQDPSGKSLVLLNQDPKLATAWKFVR